jgi:hypothetical protein
MTTDLMAFELFAGPGGWAQALRDLCPTSRHVGVDLDAARSATTGPLSIVDGALQHKVLHRAITSPLGVASEPTSRRSPSVDPSHDQHR